MLTEIPISVEYTSTAMRMTPGIKQRAQEMVDLANLAFENSLVPVKLVLVRLFNSPVVDRADPAGLLAEFTGNNRYGASMAVLLSGLVRGCGLSHQDCQWVGDKCAYGVVNVACDPLHFARAVGFIMGAGSDVASHSPSRFPFNYARVLERANGTNTVMANFPGEKIPYFSNPRVWVRGMPTGVKKFQENAKVLTMTRYAVANLQFT
jgi:hypothetical protein